MEAEVRSCGMTSSITQAVMRDGWVFVSPQGADWAFGILSELGPSISTGPNSAKYTDLVPYETFAAPPGSMSSKIGTNEQPPHTDRAHIPTPPRFVVLRCIEPGEGSCPTNLWAVDEAKLSSDRPAVLTSLQWVFCDGRNAAFYAPILEWTQGHLRIRFDPCCMQPASFCSDTVTHAEQTIKQYTQRAIIHWQAGALLVIDNWRCLHARAIGAERAKSRRLRRWYLGERHGLGKPVAL